MVKLIRLQNRKENWGMKNAKLVSRTEAEPKIYHNNVDLCFYSTFWHDVFRV